MKRIIHIINDYKIINISNARYVEKLIKETNIAELTTELEIELNLEGCLTDYPETPKLIDVFLFHLANQKGKKLLEIKFNGLGNNEINLLHDIVLEGDFFGIREKIEDNDEVKKWTTRMNKILKENSIVLNVHYTPDNKNYSYGE